MTTQQKIFFRELSKIQEYCVSVGLSKENEYNTTEEMLLDVTGEAIYRVMELLDGYWGMRDLSRCNIINIDTGENIHEGIELHDECVEYLK